MTDGFIATCRDVGKRYGKRTVLQDIDLDLHEGEVFGLLGPNGAGKTTFIKILLGLSRPASGRIDVFGLNLFRKRRQVMRRVGAVVEAPAFFEFLTAFDNLRHLVSLSGKVNRDRILETLDGVGLGSVAHDRVGTFSYGMKQRLGIAQALLPDTRLLVLDEPTNGLDPHGIAGMRRLVRKLAEERNVTILVSSHLLSEVEQICDRVMIIHKGRKVLVSDVDALRSEEGLVRVTLSQADLERPGVRELDIAHTAPDETGSTVDILVRPGERRVPELVAALVQTGASIHAVAPHRRTLEDVFIEHTQQEDSDVRADTFRD